MNVADYILNATKRPIDLILVMPSSIVMYIFGFIVVGSLTDSIGIWYSLPAMICVTVFPIVYFTICTRTTDYKKGKTDFPNAKKYNAFVEFLKVSNGKIKCNRHRMILYLMGWECKQRATESDIRYESESIEMKRLCKNANELLEEDAK